MEVREELETQERAAAERSESLRARVEEVGERRRGRAGTAGDRARRNAPRRGPLWRRPWIAAYLELYEELRPQKKGVAAVALIDGVCQGCHEQLSSVYVDRLKRSEGPKRCEHCRRILVT